MPSVRASQSAKHVSIFRAKKPVEGIRLARNICFSIFLARLARRSIFYSMFLDSFVPIAVVIEGTLRRPEKAGTPVMRGGRRWLLVTPSGGDGRHLGGVPRVRVHTPQSPPLGVEGASRPQVARGWRDGVGGPVRPMSEETRARRIRRTRTPWLTHARHPHRQGGRGHPRARRTATSRSHPRHPDLGLRPPRRQTRGASARVVTATNLGTLRESDVAPPPRRARLRR